MEDMVTLSEKGSAGLVRTQAGLRHSPEASRLRNLSGMEVAPLFLFLYWGTQQSAHLRGPQALCEATVFPGKKGELQKDRRHQERQREAEAHAGPQPHVL